MSGVTENSTTWPYPWPPHLHWLDPYLNLSSFSQEVIDGIVLGDKLKLRIWNLSPHPTHGWWIIFRTDADLADAYYNKYHANSSENMFMCTPQFMNPKYRYKLNRTNLERAHCFNYTKGMFDHEMRLGQ